jgi:hypothetical protein
MASPVRADALLVLLKAGGEAKSLLERGPAERDRARLLELSSAIENSEVATTTQTELGQAFSQFNHAFKLPAPVSVDGVAPQTKSLKHSIVPLVPALMRAYSLEGHPEPALQGLTLFWKEARRLEALFYLAQAQAFGAGSPELDVRMKGLGRGVRMPFELYAWYRQLSQDNFDLARAYFPNLPLTAPTTENQPPLVRGTSLTSEMKLFLWSFGPRTAPTDESDLIALSAEAEADLMSHVETKLQPLILLMVTDLQRIHTLIETYFLVYPQRENTERLSAQIDDLVTTDGAPDCFEFLRGKSNFDGESCHLGEFLRKLDTTIDFYFSHVGFNFPAAVIEKFSELRDQVSESGLTFEAFTPDQWANTRNYFYSYFSESDFPKQLVAPNFLGTIMDELIGLYQSDPEMRTSGLKLGQQVNRVLKNHGLLATLGFEGDYKQQIGLLVETRDKFVQRLKKTESEIESKLPAKFERLDASYDSCDVFLNDDRDHSPFVLSAVKGQLLSEDLKMEVGSEGYRRLSLSYPVKAGNAVAIQERDVQAEARAAGRAERKSLEMLIPNLVGTLNLMGEAVDLSFEGLTGISLSSLAPEVALSEMEMPSLPWDFIIGQSVKSYDDIEADYQKSKESLLKDEAKKYPDYRSYHRLKLAQVAPLMRKVKLALERAKKGEQSENAAPAMAFLLEVSREVVDGKSIDLRSASFGITEHVKFMAEDYVKRTNPKLFKARGAYDNFLRHFSIDQYFDQLDYIWGMDYVRQAMKSHPGYFLAERSSARGEALPPLPFPGRSNPGINVPGVDLLKMFWNHPTFVARMIDHFYVFTYGEKELLTYADLKLDTEAPQLLVNDQWRRYDDSQYPKTMEAYRQNTLGEIRRVANLKYTRPATHGTSVRWAAENLQIVEPELMTDYLFRNPFVTQAMLTESPNYKRAVCKYQRLKNITDTVVDLGLAAATIAAYTNPIGIGAHAAVLAVAGLRVRGKYNEIVRRERFELAAKGQRRDGDEAFDSFYQTEMEFQYNVALAFLALDGIFSGPRVIKNLPGIANVPALLGKSTKRLLIRTLPNRARSVGYGWNHGINPQSLHPMIQKSHWGVRWSAQLLNGTRYAAMSPFMAGRHIMRRRGPTLLDKFLPMLEKGQRRKIPGLLVDHALHTLKEIPVYFTTIKGVIPVPLTVGTLGFKSGTSLASKLFMAHEGYLMAATVAEFYTDWHAGEMDILIGFMYDNYQAYEPWIDRMYGGEFTQSELTAMVTYDKDFVQPLWDIRIAAKKHFEETFDDDERKTIIANLRTDAKRVEAELAGELAKSPKNIEALRVLKTETKRDADLILYLSTKVPRG